MAAQRAGALERSALVLADFKLALAALAEVEGRMAKALEELGLAELVTSIRGCRWLGPRPSWPRPATHPLRRRQGGGQARRPVPRDNASGAFAGKTTISGRGRPLLRLAAWRAVWGALPHNPVFAARYAHLTSRQHNRLSDGQAPARSPRPCWASCGWSASTGSRGSRRSPAAPPARR